MRHKVPALATLVLSAAVVAATPAMAQNAGNMTFFVTSVGSGKGADFGGLAGADRRQRVPLLLRRAVNDGRAGRAIRPAPCRFT